jgi:hypothetical protein
MRLQARAARRADGSDPGARGRGHGRHADQPPPGRGARDLVQRELPAGGPAPDLLGGDSHLGRPDLSELQGQQTGTEYYYYEHPLAAEPLLQNASRYFGTTCPRAAIDALTPVEKEGLRLGIAKKGMRKEAVILACGYPPPRDTPDLASPTWRYWASRWRYFTVTFDAKGVVEKVDYL